MLIRVGVLLGNTLVAQEIKVLPVLIMGCKMKWVILVCGVLHLRPKNLEVGENRKSVSFAGTKYFLSSFVGRKDLCRRLPYGISKFQDGLIQREGNLCGHHGLRNF